MFLCIYYRPVSDSWHRLSLFLFPCFPFFLCTRRTKKFYEVPGSPQWLGSLCMALKSHDWRLLFSRADIFSFELLVQPQRKRKDEGFKWVQAGRRDNWWTETSVFWFFVWKKKAFEKSNGWDCCLQKRKKDFVRVVYLQRWFTSFLIIL